MRLQAVIAAAVVSGWTGSRFVDRRMSGRAHEAIFAAGIIAGRTGSILLDRGTGVGPGNTVMTAGVIAAGAGPLLEDGLLSHGGHGQHGNERYGA